MLDGLEKIFLRKKRRVLGEVIQSCELTNTNARLLIRSSSQKYVLTYESEGLVAAINGSGLLSTDHKLHKEVAVLTKYIIDQGGLIINGGRSSGIMKTTSQIAQDKCMGVIFPELEREADKQSKRVLVSDPNSRIELLATCAPIIIIFRGGIGSLQILIRAIAYLGNIKYHPEQPPHMVFVNNYWIGLLTTMMNIGSLPKDFLLQINLFNKAEDIIKNIPLPAENK